MPAGAQPGALGVDCDDKDTNTLLKLASRALFSELANNKIRGFVADLELYLRMCARPVHHWKYFLLALLGAEEAQYVRRSHLADAIADYAKVKSGVEALFGTLEFEGSFRAQLRTHQQSAAESIAAYAARTTDVCMKAYPAFARETQISLAVDHFIVRKADTTTRDYLLHDRACRSLSLQEVLQMAQSCEASRLLLHAPVAAGVITSSKVAAHATATSACEQDDITAATSWQAKSSRDGRVKRGAQSKRKGDQQAHASAVRPLYMQQNAPFSVAQAPPPYRNSENSTRDSAGKANSTSKQRAITCYNCGKSGPASAQVLCLWWRWPHGAQLRDSRCSSEAQTSSSSSNAVALAGKGAAQVFASASIAGIRVADAFIDTGSAFSMLSSVLYARQRDAPVIQPFTCAATDVVGVGGASAEIRGYVNAPVEVAGVTVHHPLFVVEGLAFALLIGTEVFLSHGAVLTLDETAPVRLRSRECANCR